MLGMLERPGTKPGSVGRRWGGITRSGCGHLPGCANVLAESTSSDSDTARGREGCPQASGGDGWILGFGHFLGQALEALWGQVKLCGDTGLVGGGPGTGAPVRALCTAPALSALYPFQQQSGGSWVALQVLPRGVIPAELVFQGLWLQGDPGTPGWCLPACQQVAAPRGMPFRAHGH